MYLEHFGLDEAPFRITPHTDFFFAGANRGATLDALVYAITHDEGIVKVSGEVGSGKTMLCRVLMERLPETVITIYLANPSLSRDDILYAIADELTLVVPENARAATVLRALHTHLIQLFSEGKQVVVLIDEAHAMPADTLEEIRLLSNLESNKHKLLQLVLFGQPELNDVLGCPEMRQLKERITHNFTLEPLVHDDITGYINFRMRAAGYRGPNLFGSDAVKIISKASLGLTRRINIIADKALLAAYSSDGHQVGRAEVTAAVKDCGFSTTSFTTPYRWLPLILALIIVATLLIGISLGSHFGSLLGHSQPRAITLHEPATLPVTAPPQAPSERGLGQPTSSITPTSSLHPAASINLAPSTASTAGQTIIASDPTNEAVKLAARHSSVNLAANGASPKSPEVALGELTQARVNEGRAWLKTADDKHWVIQLLSSTATHREGVESYLSAALAANQLDGVRAYVSELPSGTRIGVIFGDFESREAAITALRSLPSTLRAGEPYPRQVIRLR